MIFKLGELFCGPGGLAKGALLADIGLKNYKVVHAWASDYDEDTCKTYRANICPSEPDSVVCEDVRKLDLSRFAPIDAFAFGAPCNDFSLLGEKKGFGGKYGKLYAFGIEILKMYRPMWFLFENVTGIKSANDGEAFSRILSDMKCAGYRLYPNLYKFEEYGIPQMRHRVIVVGIRNDQCVKFKIPSTRAFRQKTCREALENPPIPSDAPNNELTRQAPQVVERLKYIKPGENAWNADIPEHLRLKNTKAQLSLVYKRLDPNMPAYTITGSGGGVHMFTIMVNREH